jgi:hypothetical protein
MKVSEVWSGRYEMANEAATAVEKVARVKKECNDLEETAEEPFSSVCIANRSEIIATISSISKSKANSSMSTC